MITKFFKSSISIFIFLMIFQTAALMGLSEFFWEQPSPFISESGNFPVSAFNENISVIAWQEPALSGNTGEIRIGLGVKALSQDWRIKSSVGSVYPYAGAQPAILSIAVDQRDRILIAAAASSTETEILISDNRGETFRSSRLGGGSESSVAPRIFVRSDGGYLLFITRGASPDFIPSGSSPPDSSPRSLTLFYSRSDDGFTWSAFEPFILNEGLTLNFLPVHASRGGLDYVFFQSFVGTGDTAPTFQLFFKTSTNGGRTWSAARQFTTFSDSFTTTGANPARFDNQRPHLSSQAEGLFLVWERRLGSGSPQVYAAFVEENGSIRGAPQRVNSAESYCNNPVAFSYQGEPTVVWFDNRRGGSRIFMAQRRGPDWQNQDLSGSSGDASFARPVVTRDGLHIFWVSGDSSRGFGRIFVLAPDTSVNSPALQAENFVPGRRNRGDRAQIGWNIPADSSGIMGFSWSWSRDQNALPPKELSSYISSRPQAEVIADEDGSWYFSLIARDYAGNWSSPVQVEYVRDTTPPPAAAIVPPVLDEAGFLVSNTFTLGWNSPPASDVAGYTWNLDYLGSTAPFRDFDDEAFTQAAETRFSGDSNPVPRIMGSGPTASYTNQDDGVWRFSVFAIDEVGNIGPPSRIFFRTGKYIPRTFISYVYALQDEQGIVSIRLIGRGFSVGGEVSRVFLRREADDSAQKDPDLREFFTEKQDFAILSDREIAGLRIEQLETGYYRIGVEHPARGVFIHPTAIWVDKTGTVKFGDYSRTWESLWSARPRRYVLDPAVLVLTALMILCALALAVSVRGIGAVIVESRSIRLEAEALLTGDYMPIEKKRRQRQIKRHSMGLRFKLASFTIALVLLVVVMVSAPLYLMMTRTQRETLLRGLWDRSSVLLEGLASGARTYLPSQNVLELGYLVDQAEAVPEAHYVTITGFGGGSTIFNDHIWATNDPDILLKIDTAEFIPGVSRLRDAVSPRGETIAIRLNGRARADVGDLAKSITALTQEGISLATETDDQSRLRLQDIQVSVQSLEIRLNEGLTEISRGINSEPAFSLGEHQPVGTFIFFKPVMFRQGSEDDYFRGLIRLEVSIETILAAIAEGQNNLLRVILIVALAAMGIGAAGALVLAAFIIRPIHILVDHVEKIRDTEDKAKLEGVDIALKSRDELAVLGSVLNDMTHGLVKAAQAAADLSIGKEIQKKFIPLELDREGNKLSAGFKDAKHARFFGYYEGAKGVSGDYFDYQDLDGRYYAIIKCDVAGKGIPAALIMIQVATMFLNYFKAWKPTEKGMHIEEVVYQINDFIETLAFKGRFAAFTLCLFDTQTGLLRFCNAGDNLIHLFDASEKKFKTIALSETPATGVLPNILVEEKGGYKVETLTLDTRDILLLYTDGIEEAKRKFRGADFKEIICTEGPQDTPHGNHSSGQGDEEMGADRVADIINAVQNRQVYTLNKYHNGEGDVELSFDFSICQGTVEETIMAMVSVEKIFRCYRNPQAGEETRVLVDRKVDDFLKKHFLQYRTYCSDTRDYPGNDAYLYYTHLDEDAQYDDLTILGIMRK
ncbi:hypothetical protein AGMMS49928_08100 [Spirochaetia bacterium]|nr:hypothetical protein AGMMS49928_08100 [Spirochaetia bacterium]